MFIKRIRPLGAALFLLTVCLHPAASLEAASEALTVWRYAVAPALLPFLIAAPALTGSDACALLSRILHPLLRFLRLPANSAGALIIGLLSGSPAGASALSMIPGTPSDPPGAYLRAAVLASGASPAFLITGVAAGMLNAPETGWLLLRSQFLSALLACLLLRPAGGGNNARPGIISPRTHGPVLSAMLTLLTVAGYMTLFSVIARLISHLLHPAAETPLLAVLELAGGCRALSALPAPLSFRLPLISAAACFGGVSVYLQSMSFLAQAGVKHSEYAAGKLIQSALAALITHLQLVRPLKTADPLLLCLLALSLLILAVMLRTLFSWNRLQMQKTPHRPSTNGR